jgi:hypothetical protein
MATNINSYPTNTFPGVMTATNSEADRRREPRFGAEGEVAVMVPQGSAEVELKAKLMDFSLHGLRVRMAQDLAAGQNVRVFFSWGEICTTVMWTTPVDNAFDIGLQLF